MSLKRVLGLSLSLLDLIVIVSLFLPYSAGKGLFFASDSAMISAIILLVMSAIGFLFGIIGKNVEINYANFGAATFYGLSILVTVIQAGATADFFKNVQFGFYVFMFGAVFGLIGSLVYNLTKGPDKSNKTVTVVNGSNNNGVQQRTNSLNMNMPVNNYQSLPVNIAEKKKAPMDVLLRGKDSEVPLGSTVVGNNTVQSHMTELGLKSINISKDNLTGAIPGQLPPVQKLPMPGQEPVPGMPGMPASQQMPMPAAQPVQQAAPVNPAVAAINQQINPGAQQVQAQPGMPVAPVGQPGMPGAPMTQTAPQKPDLLAGSSMSGQLNSSPYNEPPQFF